MAKKTVMTARHTKKPAGGTANPPTKQNVVLALLQRANGASVVEIIEATEWQPHSVRRFFSGL